MDSCAGPVPAAGDRAVSKAAGPLRSHSLPSGRGDSPRELHEESRVVSAPENCFPGFPTAPPKQPWTWPGTCFEPGPPPAFPGAGGGGSGGGVGLQLHPCCPRTVLCPSGRPSKRAVLWHRGVGHPASSHTHQHLGWSLLWKPW